LLVAGTLVVSSSCLAATGDNQTLATNSQSDIQSELRTIESLWRGKKFTEAVQIMQTRVASQDFGSLEPDIQTEYFYGLACGASLLGKPGEAVAYLGMAVGSGFKNFSHLKADTDLDPIRKDPGFLVLSEIVRVRGDGGH